MRATADLPLHPLSGDVLDIDAAGTALGPSSLVEVWNCFAKDDGTLTRRPGLGSYHEAFDASGSALNGLGLTSMEVLGLTQFDRVTDAGGTATIYLAKVNDYLIGSLWGTRYDKKLANHLGVASVADFTEVYVRSERQRYIVVCTNDSGFIPSYWRGNLTPSVSAYDVQPWEYFKTIPGVGHREFSTLHKGRLYLAGGDPFLVIVMPEDDFRDTPNASAFAMAAEHGRVTGFIRTYYGELLIGQERAISRVVYDSLGDPADAVPVVTGIGLANNRSSVPVGNDVYFLGTDGQVYSLETTDRFGDLRFNAVSGPIYRQFDKAPLAARPYSWGQLDRENQIAWFGIAKYGGLKVDTCWGFDYARKKPYRLANRAFHGPSCAAAWRLPRFNGIEKVVFGNYETDDFLTEQKGRIWHFTDRHKEDHFLRSVSEAVDATTPGHLKPFTKFPDANYGGGAAGWPHQSQVVVAGTYSGAATTYTTITVRITSISAGTGVIGTGTIAATWLDVKGGATGTFALGAAYTPGTALAFTGTGITIAFNAAQTLPVHVGDEVWVLVDRAYRRTESYRAGLADNIDFKCDFQLVNEGDTYKNFVARASTPLIFMGTPDKPFELDAITFITRVTGNRADDQNASESSESSQNIFRHSLDVLLRCDEDVRWRQLALLDGNAAKQHHLDPSLGEQSGKYVNRKDRQFMLGSTETLSGRFLWDGTVNIERVKIGRRVKNFRLMFGQFTMAVNSWSVPFIDPFNGFTGDFGLVGYIVHTRPIADDVPSIQGDSSMSKSWSVGA